MQMDCSSASSKILFHGLPSKSKRLSVMKHSAVDIITVNNMFLQNSQLQGDISQIFYPQYFCEL